MHVTNYYFSPSSSISGLSCNFDFLLIRPLKYREREVLQAITNMSAKNVHFLHYQYKVLVVGTLKPGYPIPLHYALIAVLWNLVFRNFTKEPTKIKNMNQMIFHNCWHRKGNILFWKFINSLDSLKKTTFLAAMSACHQILSFPKFIHFRSFS